MIQVNWWAMKDGKAVSGTIRCKDGEEFAWGQRIAAEAASVGADEWEWQASKQGSPDAGYRPAWWPYGRRGFSADYETGYRDGGASAHADWGFHLNEFGGFPDGFEITPGEVSAITRHLLDPQMIERLKTAASLLGSEHLNLSQQLLEYALRIEEVLATPDE